MQNISSPRNNGKTWCVFLASHQLYFTCIIEWTTVCFGALLPILIPISRPEEAGGRYTINSAFVRAGVWTGRPPKGAEVVKKYDHCYNAVLEQEKSMGEEVAQSLSLILSHPSGIERAQIPSDWVHKGQGLWHRERKKADTNRIPIQLETAAVRVRFQCARIYIPL